MRGPPTTTHIWVPLDRSSATKSPFSPQRTDFRSEHTTATRRLSNPLHGKEELKQVEITQIKDEIRYLSQSDKIENTDGSIGNWSAFSLTESDRIAQLQSAKKSNGRGG